MMNFRTSLLMGILTLTACSSALACGGSCYRPPVYRQAHYRIHQGVHQQRQVAPPRTPSSTQQAPLPVPTPSTVTPPQKRILAAPQQPSPQQPAINAVQPAPTPATTPPTPTAPSVPAEEDQPTKKRGEANPFAALDTQTLLKISGVQQILQGN